MNISHAYFDSIYTIKYSAMEMNLFILYYFK